MARALLVRGAGLPVSEVLVASTRPERVAETVGLLEGGAALPAGLAALLERVVADVRAAPAPRPTG